MTSLEEATSRLYELGDVPELVAWLEREGLDLELMLFAAFCAAFHAREHGREGLSSREGATAFLVGLLSGICMTSALTHASAEPAAALTAALSAVADQGRHTVIARHCDLSAVATIELTVADELGAGHTDTARAVGCLYETGLATGLALRTCR